MHRLRRDAEVLAEQPAEAGGVEDGAGADDASGRQAGEAGRDLGHHVDGVGGDEQDRVGGGVEDAGDHVAEHRGVAAEEREAGLARRLRHAGGDDDDAGAGEVGGSRRRRRGWRRRRARRGRCPRPGRGRARGRGRRSTSSVAVPAAPGVGGGAADLAGADDADLHWCPPGNSSGAEVRAGCGAAGHDMVR